MYADYNSYKYDAQERQAKARKQSLADRLRNRKNKANR